MTPLACGVMNSAGSWRMARAPKRPPRAGPASTRAAASPAGATPAATRPPAPPPGRPRRTVSGTTHSPTCVDSWRRYSHPEEGGPCDRAHVPETPGGRLARRRGPGAALVWGGLSGGDSALAKQISAGRQSEKKAFGRQTGPRRARPDERPYNHYSFRPRGSGGCPSRMRRRRCKRPAVNGGADRLHKSGGTPEAAAPGVIGCASRFWRPGIGSPGGAAVNSQGREPLEAGVRRAPLLKMVRGCPARRGIQGFHPWLLTSAPPGLLTHVRQNREGHPG